MHIVVTGASSGIGREIAKAFDRPENKIALVARRKSLLEALGKDIHAETRAIGGSSFETPMIHEPRRNLVHSTLYLVVTLRPGADASTSIGLAVRRSPSGP